MILDANLNLERNENMSQEKVNRYKNEKKNRKKTVSKAKRTDLYINLFLITVTLIICVFIAWSVYAEFFKKDEPVRTVNKLSSGEISRIIDRNKDDKDEDSSDESESPESESPENETSGETVTSESAE